LKFYAPWCGHCKRMAPILDELALEVGAPAMRFGKIDCTVETSLRSKWNVSGYPTVYLYQGGRNWRHAGLRSKQGLLDVIRRVQADAVRELAHAADLEDMLAPSRVVFVLAQSKTAGAHTGSTLFQETAIKLKHSLTFAATSADDVLTTMAAGGDELTGGLPFVAKLEAGERAQILPGASIEGMGQEAFETWMSSRRFPLVSLVSGFNFHEISKAGRLFALLLIDPCGGDDTQPIVECERDLVPSDLNTTVAAAFREVARAPDANDLQMSYNFGVMNSIRWETFANDHHIKRSDLPRLLILKRDGASSSTVFFKDDSTAGEAKTMRHFLVSVAAGLVMGEYEGAWGFPARTWQRVVSWVPPLHALDALPNWSFVIVLVPFVLYLVVALVLWQPKSSKGTKKPSDKQQ